MTWENSSAMLANISATLENSLVKSGNMTDLLGNNVATLE